MQTGKLFMIWDNVMDINYQLIQNFKQFEQAI